MSQISDIISALVPSHGKNEKPPLPFKDMSNKSATVLSLLPICTFTEYDSLDQFVGGRRHSHTSSTMRQSKAKCLNVKCILDVEAFLHSPERRYLMIKLRDANRIEHSIVDRVLVDEEQKMAASSLPSTRRHTHTHV